MVQDAPKESITLAMLVGEKALLDWSSYLHTAQKAFDAIREGRRPQDPGHFVIRVSSLPAWARCFVWDAEDPAD